jgi:hypothetical protein
MRQWIRSHLSYANVMATIAVFLVLGGGTAVALDGSNTVFSDDIVNGEVKVADVGQGAVATEEIANGQVKAPDIGDGEVLTPEIANGQVKNADIGAGEVRTGNVLNDNLTGGDISPDSRKGADIDEGSLAGGLIPGIATSGLVKSSGIVRVNIDPQSFATRPLINAGPFVITGECLDFDNSQQAQIIAQSSAAGWSVDSEPDGGLSLSDLPSGQTVGLVTANAFSVPDLEAGDYALAAPNKILTGEAFAAVNVMGSDCAFGITGIG